MLDIYEFITWSKEERQAHLNLSEPCIFRGTNSTECRGLLAHALNTTVPRGAGIHCCHACHDGRCANWRHLYWGTAQENFEDMKDAGTCGLIENWSKDRFGKNNINYGLAPWKNVNNKKEQWSWAADIYDDYVKNGWDWFSYGKGKSFLIARYGLSGGPAKNMIKKFRQGWIPLEDPEWIEDFKAE